MSDDVQRFSFCRTNGGEVVESGAGGYVLYEDYDRLRAEVERLKSREITDEQIDAAWEVVRVPANAYAARQTLASFRVFPCKECGGSGKFPDRVQAWDIPGAPVPECERCNGHGWIREEHGDE